MQHVLNDEADQIRTPASCKRQVEVLQLHQETTKVSETSETAL